MYTPDKYILYGITRAVVLKLARGLVPVRYAVPTVTILSTADECFMTRSSIGIVPIIRINKKKIADGKPGPVTKRLMKLFDEYVKIASSAIQNVGLMGILNVTPDSFSDGGRYATPAAAVKHALQLVTDGASVIDIGGESSRPGAKPVSVQTELKRVIPVIKALRKKSRIPISIDTYKPTVAEAALKAGATWVNDITGLRNPEMRQVVANSGCLVVIMHMPAYARATAGKLGTPQDVHRYIPKYHDIIKDISLFFEKQIAVAQVAGILKKNIILDPGIGFGKTVQHNIEILRRLSEFKSFHVPIMIGASRKSFIGKLTDADMASRLSGTLAAHAIAFENGATWLRVHDVAEHAQYLMIAGKLMP